VSRRDSLTPEGMVTNQTFTLINEFTIHDGFKHF